MNKKGISPLIAAVILIAATMTLAGILAYWASSFVRGKLEGKENVTEEVLCSGAEIKIYGTPNYNETTQELSMIVQNVYGFKFKKVEVDIFYPDNNIVEIPLETKLEQKYNLIKLENVSSGFTEVKVVTNCPNVEATWKP